MPGCDARLSCLVGASRLLGALAASLKLRHPFTLIEPHLVLVEDMRAALCHEEVLGREAHKVVETGQETIDHRLAGGNELEELGRVERPDDIIDELRLLAQVDILLEVGTIEADLAIASKHEGIDVLAQGEVGRVKLAIAGLPLEQTERLANRHRAADARHDDAPLLLWDGGGSRDRNRAVEESHSDGEV